MVILSVLRFNFHHSLRRLTAHSLENYDVIKWKHFPRHCPFEREIHQSHVDSPHKGQWRRALMSSLICAWANRSANNRDTRDLRRYHVQYDVTVVTVIGWFTVEQHWRICLDISYVSNESTNKAKCTTPHVSLLKNTALLIVTPNHPCMTITS